MMRYLMPDDAGARARGLPPATRKRPTAHDAEHLPTLCERGKDNAATQYPERDDINFYIQSNHNVKQGNLGEIFTNTS